ncbi:MAG TPA: 2,4-diaminopentanoate dehydrogenase [Bacillota bacterium]|nr:2,4-diaminopentanoate dehydrogenase [Bacillota bacterium]HOL12643.1 2,4-diaminopentanoate dehydrogenase [Bacillota bacterium]
MLWGLGAMGSGMASMLLQKRDVEIVAAVAKRPSREGKDLGEIIGTETTGIKVVSNPEEAFKSNPDIVLHSTASFVKEVFPEIKLALEHDANVITIAEEMAYPWIDAPELSQEMDDLARSRGKAVLGTGINPGFVLDTLIITATGICKKVNHVHGKRVNNLAPFGPTVMRTQGVGTTPEEFKQGLTSGAIVGHVGFRQSIMLIANALGWHIQEIVEEREPIISKVRRTTDYVDVAPGNVAGCRHTARAYADGREVILLEHPQQVCPELEGIQTGDYILIDGDPPVDLRIEPEIPGGTGTMAIAVNMIPLVMSAPSGLLTMADLPVPRWLPDVVRQEA